MLVTFEGQPGAGKSALIAEVERLLRAQGMHCASIGEVTTVPRERWLGAARWYHIPQVETEGPARVIARALEAVLDLYHQDEYEIGPALSGSDVVLKDRHMDSLIYTLAPALGFLKAFHTHDRAVVWLGLMLSELKHKPDLTVYVDASLPTRAERLAACKSAIAETYTCGLIADAVTVFDGYERVARQLIGDDQQRFVVVENEGEPLEKTAGQIVSTIRARYSIEGV
jgi:thymidylate kinase